MVFALVSAAMTALLALAFATGLRKGRMPFKYERWEPSREGQPVRYWTLAAIYGVGAAYWLIQTLRSIGL